MENALYLYYPTRVGLSPAHDFSKKDGPMKSWQLTTPHHVERATAPDISVADGTAKIKITKALLTEADISVFTGATKVKAPIIPGRFAIGQVTEAGMDSFMQKGDRVYLADVVEDENGELQVAGETCEGFYKDFEAHAR